MRLSLKRKEEDARSSLKGIDYIVTIDASSSAIGYSITKVVKCVPELIAFGRVTKPEYKESLTRIPALVDGVIGEIKPLVSGTVIVMVEQPFYSAGQSNGPAIIMTLGALLYALYGVIKEYMWIFVHVSSWRSKFLGKELNKKGTDKKKLVLEKVNSLAEVKRIRVADNDDEADAIGIYRYAIDHFFND